jgi:hypothetical protein
LRKSEPDFAKEISLIFLDGVLSVSNIPGDIQNERGRKEKLIESYLEESLSFLGISDDTTRRVVTEAKFVPEEPVDGESILKQA